MDILLVKPAYPYPYSKGEHTCNHFFPPLSLANCAAILEKAAHRVKILDAHVLGIKPERIAGYIKGYDKVFVTSSSLDRWQCPNIDNTPFLETVRNIRRLTDEVYVMGYHSTVEAKEVLNSTGAKAAIRGEPEYTVFDICQSQDLSGIKGIVYRNGEEVVFTLEREPLDLKELPVPAFHLLNFKKYFYEILGGRFSLFEISRGCKFRCRFCNKVMYGEGLRTKSKEQIFQEVSLAVEKYKVKTAYFMDLDFLSNKEIVSELCEYLIKRRYKLKWVCQTRPDFLDNEILKKMKRAGCRIIHIGVETGSQRLLDDFNKGITIDKIRKTVEMCKSRGIKTLAFFLFGLPGETRQERENSFKFAKELNTEFVSFHKVFPYLGSGIHRDNFKFDEEVDKFIRSAFIRYYLRFSYLWKINLGTILKGLRLFLGRLRTL